MTVARDALGIPTIRGASREDVARATGFVHAQDRFFQMDLMRRRAAGELAALVGERALEVDREIRIHRFRARGRRGRWPLLPAARPGAARRLRRRRQRRPRRRSRRRPFEYLLLRQDPAALAAEDSLLVVLSMFITLQDAEAAYESMLGDDARRPAAARCRPS